MGEKEVNLEKTKQILQRMDDAYWRGVTSQNVALNDHMQQLLANFQKGFIRLTVARLNVLDAKSNGYQAVLAETKKTARQKIIASNKKQLEALTQEKTAAVEALTSLLTQFDKLIKDGENLGVLIASNDGQGNRND